MAEKRKINFLLYGEGSVLNKGCEAIVNTTIKKIQKSCEGNIVLATNDIQNDTETFGENITKYIRQNPEDGEFTEEEISKADICLSVGGDNYSYGEPQWLYDINKKIKKMNKKNVLWCASLYDEIKSDEMIRDLRTFDAIIVRESLSYKAVEKYVEKDKILKLPDTAFSLAKKEVELPQIFKENKKVVGINISPLISNYTDDENNILQSVQALINHILNNTNYNIALIPHVYIEGNNDLDSLSMVKNLYQNEKRIQVVNERIYNCEEIKYIISNCSYLIAARTHASIAGYSTYVPTLVIGYSVKSRGIAIELFGESENYVIPVDQMTPEKLVERFKFIEENESEIINKLKTKIPEIKEQADNLVNILLDKLEELDKKYITTKNKCTGCMACLNACPNDAIEIITSKDGFEYPKINEEKCIHCNICRKVCPQNKYYKNEYKEPECYAVYNLNEKDRGQSSSGGIVSLLAKEIIHNKGTVYGVILENLEAKHIRVDSENDLYKIQGSKYIQSNINLIYKSVKQDLEEKKSVLFTGTPCQIEGLKSYLNKDYDNLLCVSIICHGVPSPEIFKKYIKEKNDKIINVNFRNKKMGWHNFSMEYEYQDGTKEIVSFKEDTYMNGFLKNLFLRESCYNCQMRFDTKNTADIIIGDFWGIENILPKMDDDKGISALILNSNKGKEIFEKIKENTNFEKTTIEEIYKCNPVLFESVEYTKKRDDFYELMESNKISTYINVLKHGEKADTKKEEELYNEVKQLNIWMDDLLEAKEYFLGQIEEKEQKISEDNKEKQQLLEEKQRIEEEIQKIYDSKRWKYANKIGNIFNKLKGSKK